MLSESETQSARAGIQRARPGEVRVRRALLSVSDKSGIVEFARGLSELGVEIVSTGGTGRPRTSRAPPKHRAVGAVVVDPAYSEPGLAELRRTEGRLSSASRTELAAKAFACTARYDAAISTWFAMRTYEGFPPAWRDAYEKVMDLRYGENPHQRAAFYARVGERTHLLEGVRQLHGKELSFNNLLDLSSARELLEALAGPACAIVKHNNPCGCALAGGGQAAYERAFACDPQSAYGGVIAVNERVDRAFASSLSKQFIEVLLAPGFDDDALQVLGEKKNVRLLELSPWPEPHHELE